MRIAIRLVLFAVLSTAAEAQTPGPTPAQVPPAQISISGWRLECDSLGGGLQCQLIDQITARGNNAVISAISVRRTSDAGMPVMIVQVPLGIAVDDAVRVGFENGAVQTLPVFTCNRNGCFARAQIGEPVLSAMRGAKQQLRVAYQNLDANGGKQTVTISLALDGFPSAYERLR